MNSQETGTKGKTLQIADWRLIYAQNLSCGCSCIDIVCDSYFNNSLKSHTPEARGCGQRLPFVETTNIQKYFQDNFLRHNRNSRAGIYLFKVFFFFFFYMNIFIDIQLQHKKVQSPDIVYLVCPGVK